jgi:hypothetical protein
VSHNAGLQVPEMGRAASPKRVHGERWCAVGKMVTAGRAGQNRAEVGVSPLKIAADGSRESRVRGVCGGGATGG